MIFQSAWLFSTRPGLAPALGTTSPAEDPPLGSGALPALQGTPFDGGTCAISPSWVGGLGRGGRGGKGVVTGRVGLVSGKGIRLETHICQWVCLTGVL